MQKEALGPPHDLLFEVIDEFRIQLPTTKYLHFILSGHYPPLLEITLFA